MVFSDSAFVFLFLPIALITLLTVSRLFVISAVVFSLLFYAWSSGAYVFILAGNMALNYWGNEFQAYISFSKMKDAGLISDPKSILITTYALCGFANFASIGIQIGGISQLAPNQRKNLTELGIKALIGGTIACLMCACIAGALM